MEIWLTGSRSSWGTGTYPWKKKKELLGRFLRKEAVFPEDILLYELRGRYLFFMAELFSQGGEGPVIRDMTVFFPGRTGCPIFQDFIGERKMGRISLRGIWVFSRAFMMILAGGSVPAAGSWIRRIRIWNG